MFIAESVAMAKISELINSTRESVKFLKESTLYLDITKYVLNLFLNVLSGRYGAVLCALGLVSVKMCN